MRGVYKLEVTRADGSKEYRTAPNTPTDEAFLQWLDYYETGENSRTEWHMGFVLTTPFSGYSDADTLASHAGWTEHADRVSAFTAGAGAAVDDLSASIALSKTAYSPAAQSDIRGLYLADVASGTAGLLWSGADFTEGTIVLEATDSILITYTLTLAAG